MVMWSMRSKSNAFLLGVLSLHPTSKFVFLFSFFLETFSDGIFEILIDILENNADFQTEFWKSMIFLHIQHKAFSDGIFEILIDILENNADFQAEFWKSMIFLHIHHKAYLNFWKKCVCLKIEKWDFFSLIKQTNLSFKSFDSIIDPVLGKS